MPEVKPLVPSPSRVASPTTNGHSHNSISRGRAQSVSSATSTKTGKAKKKKKKRSRDSSTANPTASDPSDPRDEATPRWVVTRPALQLGGVFGKIRDKFETDISLAAKEEPEKTIRAHKVRTESSSALEWCWVFFLIYIKTMIKLSGTTRFDGSVA